MSFTCGIFCFKNNFCPKSKNFLDLGAHAYIPKPKPKNNQQKKFLE